MDIDNDTLVTFLGRTHLFHDFRKREVEAILPYIMLVRAEPNTVIFDQDEEGDAWYVVLTGKILIARDLNTKKPHELALLKSGDCFGEMALIDGSPRMAGARAKGEVILARLSRESFEQLLGNDLPLAVRLLRTMAGVLCTRSRELTELMERVMNQKKGPTNESMDALAKALTRQVTWN
ncbi:MAG TPA: hypothetical protein DIU15_03830 [Deltaproteobacteria bacterium]|nr:hypothetical protein [Deltaproteobacteria bacterium]HCP45143.1 hypothetical protein [Deltaproteobacteria bacterium]